MRVQLTVPLPVPLPVVNVVQLLLSTAIHAALDALVPVRVTVALPLGAATPCCTVMESDAGLTASTIGIGGAVIRSVSTIKSGEPLAAPGAATVMVST